MPETKTENKVQFNLKNVHYAVLTDGAAPAWGTPVHVPGAVSLALDPQGEVTKFHADGIIYYQAVANNGYSGDLTMARFIDRMLQDVWGYQMTSDGVMLENSTVEPKPFALLFQIDGDADNEYYLLYNCSGTRPAIGGETNNETKTPQTKSSSISAVSLQNGLVMARTTAETSAEVKAAWFTKVYEAPADESTEEGA